VDGLTNDGLFQMLAGLPMAYRRHAGIND